MQRYLNDDVTVIRDSITIPRISIEELAHLLVEAVKSECGHEEYAEMLEEFAEYNPDFSASNPMHTYGWAVGRIINGWGRFHREERIMAEVDHENYEFEWRRIPESVKYLDLHIIDGIAFCGILTGGDWEYPLFEILYWDGERIRPYIPTRGNAMNPHVPCAFGSEGDEFGDWGEEISETGQQMKRWLQDCGVWPESLFNEDPDSYIEWGHIYASAYGINLEKDSPYNWEAMWEEIKSVIKPR